MPDWMTQFQPDKWAKLSADERLSLLQEAENRVAAEEHRLARTIVPQKMEDKRGYYSQEEPSKIYINEDLINTTYLDKSQLSGEEWPGYTASIALETVYHEGRHAFQDDCVAGRPAVMDGKLRADKLLRDYANVDSKTLELWKMQDLIYFSKETIGEDLPDADYWIYFQPVEDDAEDFAMKKLQEFAAQLGDADFSLCCDTQIGTREIMEKAAEDMWQSSDFRKKIADEIVSQYARSGKTPPSEKETAPAKDSAIPAAVNIGMRKAALVQYTLFGGILLYLLIIYWIADPSGLVPHLLFILAAIVPFLPVILLLRFFPKLHNKKGGILLCVIFAAFLLLIQLVYSWLMVLFLVGSAFFLLKVVGSSASNRLTIVRENADGTTTTETRILGDNAAAEIAGVKAQLRSEGYTNIREE